MCAAHRWERERDEKREFLLPPTCLSEEKEERKHAAQGMHRDREGEERSTGSMHARHILFFHF